MDDQSGPRTSREDENPSTLNINTRVPARLAGNTGTEENTYGIKKVQTYQHIVTAIIADTSRNTVRIE